MLYHAFLCVLFNFLFGYIAVTLHYGMDVVGFYDGNHMSVVYDGVEFSVFSDELGPEEMMEVINSMQVAVMK